MTDFLIKIDDVQPKKQVTITVDGSVLFSANLKVRNEQLLDHLTRFFLQCIREDIGIQEEVEKQELGIWRK